MLLSIQVQFLDSHQNLSSKNLTHVQCSQNSNTKDINPNINFDFEENSPFQEGIMCETFQRPDKSFFSGT